MGQGQIDVLLVEDNPGDARLTAEALTENRLQGETVHVVHDGVEAMAFLHRTGSYTQMPRPDLILLDLNMPKKDGREVLAEVKSDDTLNSIPVVVLTTSQSEQDIVQSYYLNANSYVTKSIDFEEFLAAVKSIHSFWLRTATLPCT